MLHFKSSIYAAILPIFLLLLPCEGKGKWGGEVSTESFGLIKSFSLKNELVMRLKYRWGKSLQYEWEHASKSEGPDTTYYKHEWTREKDHNNKDFSLAIAFRRYIGSGKGLSPNVGLAVEVTPRWGERSYDKYDEEDSLYYSYEYTSESYSLSLLLNGGCRYLFNEHIAVGVYANLVSYVWNKDEDKHKYFYPDEETRTSNYMSTSQYLRFEMYPTLCLQYYF